MRTVPARWFLMVALFLSSLVPASASARDKRPDYTIIYPNVSAGRYLTVHEGENLLKGRFNLGLYFDYLRRPIQLRNVATNQRFDIVRDAVNAHVVGAVGITDWLQGGLAVPIALYEVFFDPIEQRNTGGNAGKQIISGFGDVRAEAKFRLLDIDRYKVGVVAVPYMIFPTGRKGSFISNETFTPGVKVGVEGNIKDQVWIGFNAGYQYVRRSNQYFPGNANAVYDDILSLSLGSRVKLTDDWGLIGEALTQTNFRSAFQQVTQTPFELLAGVQWTPQKWSTWRGFNMTLAGGGGLTRGVGSPQAHVIVGINYRKPKIVTLERTPKRERVRVTDVQVEEKIIISQKIHFEFNRSNIRPVSFPILNDVADLLHQYPQIHRVRVEGHTDWIGSDAANLTLSERRALAVVQYLMQKGAAADRLTPVGYGKTRPIADNHTVAGRAMNRRTEFTVVE